MGGRLLGNNRRYYNNTPFRRGGQIRVIGMPTITMKKKHKCKSCKRK
jgi:hypothetical protein